MAGIPVECPIWSISYCGPMETDLSTENLSLTVERVKHNFRLLRESTPKGGGTDVQDMERCMKLNPKRCLRASISLQACENLIATLQFRSEKTK